MPEDDLEKKSWLPNIKFSKKSIARKMRKVEGATIRHTHKFIIKRWANVRESQRHIVFWILAMGILIAATGLQLMWFQQSYKTPTGANDGVYAEAVLGPVDTLNPLFASSSAEQSASYLMFSRLTSYDKTGHLGYDLATNVSSNADKTIYTVKIRDDAHWSDGVDLTARDIVFTIGLINNPSVRTTVEGWNDVAVKAIDNFTVEFSLRSTYAAFEHALTFPIVPEHILGSVNTIAIRENSFGNSPVGSGPFIFSFTQDIDKSNGRKVIHMTHNESYYRGNAKLGRFQLHVYNNSEQIARAISAGEVNSAADLRPADLKSINDNRYNIESNPINSGVYAIVNTTSPVWQDVTLRRSLQSATNTDDILSELPDTTQQLDLPLINNQLTGDLPVAPKYDLAGAQKMLDDAGWVVGEQGIRQKDGKDLKLSIVTMKNSEFERVLEILTGQWRLLGISIETKVVDPNDVSQNVFQGILQPRNYDVLLYQLNIGADPDVYAYWHSSQASVQGSNFANYSNAVSDDALSSARVRFEPSLRNAKYITFAKQWLSDVPAIGLYQATAQYVSSKNVKSVGDENILISSIDRYSDVLNWSVGTRSVYKTP
ncbi:MAG: peptide ABC transporter substrate-binding protein [Candidatus Saccharibacteria bacterium]